MIYSLFIDSLYWQHLFLCKVSFFSMFLSRQGKDWGLCSGAWFSGFSGLDRFNLALRDEPLIPTIEDRTLLGQKPVYLASFATDGTTFVTASFLLKVAMTSHWKLNLWIYTGRVNSVNILFMLLRGKLARTGGQNAHTHTTQTNKTDCLDKKFTESFPSNSSECSCVYPAMCLQCSLQCAFQSARFCIVCLKNCLPFLLQYHVPSREEQLVNISRMRHTPVLDAIFCNISGQWSTAKVSIFGWQFCSLILKRAAGATITTN